MKRIFVNLKRFDVPRHLGGLCPMDRAPEWVQWIVAQSVAAGLGKLQDLTLTYLLPESLIVPAMEALKEYPDDQKAGITIGSQSVYRADVKSEGNFGAFTADRPAAAMRALGCEWSMVAHSEERKDKLQMLAAFEPKIDTCESCAARAAQTVDTLVGQEAARAIEQGMKVIFCIGETAAQRGEGSFEEQQPRIKAVLEQQLGALKGIGADEGNLVIGYEPVWAIGPGKTPPGPDYIAYVSDLIKKIGKETLGIGDLPVVYGGGLKEENAGPISQIATIDGGLVALTRFSGEIGFYPDELAKIIAKYQGK